MSTEIAKIETYSALDAAIGSDLDGEPLRFKDGMWLQGFDRNEVEAGTIFRVAPTSVQDGFVKWENGRPVDWRMREWISTAQLPVCRESLGDVDESEWTDGKDPWAYTMLLAVKDGEDKLYKFSTSSVGGANAVRRLLRAWKGGRYRHPGQVPVVAIGTDHYVHKAHKNKVHFPTFEIVGWDYWDAEAARLVPNPDDPRTQFAHVLESDTIPFAPEWRA